MLYLISNGFLFKMLVRCNREQTSNVGFEKKIVSENCRSAVPAEGCDEIVSKKGLKLSSSRVALLAHVC